MACVREECGPDEPLFRSEALGIGPGSWRVVVGCDHTTGYGDDVAPANSREHAAELAEQLNAAVAPLIAAARAQCV